MDEDEDEPTLRYYTGRVPHEEQLAWNEYMSALTRSLPEIYPTEPPAGNVIPFPVKPRR